MSCRRIGSGAVDDQAEEPVALGQLADPCVLLRRQPVRDESLQASVLARSGHAERHVAGADECRCGLDDAVQDAVQRQVTRQSDDRVEQQPQVLPTGYLLACHDTSRSVDAVVGETRHASGPTPASRRDL